MNNTSISEEQILKLALRKIFQEDFARNKIRTHPLREELAKKLSNKFQNELLTTDELCAELNLRALLFINFINEKKKAKPIQPLHQVQTGRH